MKIDAFVSVFSSEKKSRLLMLILTAVYTAISLLGLGTTRFPQTSYSFDTYDDIVIDLGATSDVASIWINGNIATGHILITSEDGNIFDYYQQFGEMFSWRVNSTYFHTRTLTLTLVSGTVSINELAFFDPEGKRIDARISSGSDVSAARLLDEQDTVPSAPDRQNGMYFDEIYHARTAYEFLHGLSAYEWTHPPLGKEIIAIGILLFGMTPFGWRIMPALFGAAMLPLMYCLGKRLFRRNDYAFLAALLFALDTLHFTQTRIATVDVFIVFFILLMYLFMLEFLQRDLLNVSVSKSFLPLGLSGISFGLGVASKWTGLYAGLGLAVIFFAHMIRLGTKARKDAGLFRIYRARLWKTLMFCVVFFVFVPGCIYMISYLPFYKYEMLSHPGMPYGFREAWQTIVQQQQSMFGYHSNLKATHPCQSVWYEWVLSARGVWFYFRSLPGGKISNITAIGNPAVWWIGAAGTVCSVIALFDRSIRGEEKRPLLFLLAAVLANLLPWTLVPRCTFLYHFFPTLPFVILTALYGLSRMENERTTTPSLKWCWAVAALVFFGMMYPAASGMPVSAAWSRFIEYILPTGIIYFGAV